MGKIIYDNRFAAFAIIPANSETKPNVKEQKLPFHLALIIIGD